MDVLLNQGLIYLVLAGFYWHKFGLISGCWGHGLLGLRTG